MPALIYGAIIVLYLGGAETARAQRGRVQPRAFRLPVAIARADLGRSSLVFLVTPGRRLVPPCWSSVGLIVAGGCTSPT